MVVTDSNNTKIPDLSSVGISLPTDAFYQWQVLGIAPYNSVDAATGPNGYTEDFSKAFFNLFSRNSNCWSRKRWCFCSFSTKKLYNSPIGFLSMNLFSLASSRAFLFLIKLLAERGSHNAHSFYWTIKGFPKP